MPTCVVLDPQNVADLSWMPKTCAYRLLSEGRDLPAWHPLVSGDPQSVHRSGNSVRGKVLSEDNIPEEDLPHHLSDFD